jgi:hypothetical protein
MIAGMAITAADPSGLWGLLKESFAGGTALTKAITGADTNALVKAVVADFSSSEGRSAARDGLKTKFAVPQTSRSKPSTRYVRFPRCSMQRPQAMQLRLKLGFARSVRPPLKRPARAVVCLEPAGFK